jgi:AAA family ATP:ADP antiporter
MFKRVMTALWGKFENREEVQKFAILSFMFFLIIGTYWAMRPIKDGLFANIVGVDYIPWAKLLSLMIITPLVVIYSKLVDLLPRHRVFYILISLYTLAALAFAYLLNHAEYGIPNTTEDPTRILGWLWYVYVESFGSLIVALFWAFTTDITQEESAKRGFPVIALGGQMGNMVGPMLRAKYLGLAHSGPIVYLAAFLMVVTGFLMWLFMRVTPQQQLVGFEEINTGHTDTEAHKEPGFFEGLRLMLTKPYLLGIFLVIFFFEVIITVIDFLFKTTAKAAFPLERDFSGFLASYGSMTGVVSTLCVLFGINNIQRYLGVNVSLVLTPLMLACAVISVKFYPAIGVLYWIMVLAKAINYALNQPTIKQLYIPTSKDAKYKTQAWIEMFGSRGSKATASGVNMFRGFLKSKYGAAGVTVFLTLSTGVSLGLIVVWLFVVAYLSKAYKSAINSKRVVC